MFSSRRCLAVLMALNILVGVVILGWLGLWGFYFVDSVGITPTKTAITVIEAKQVAPAHTAIIPVYKTIIPQYNPESYRLYFKIDGKQVSSSVEKKFFDSVKVRDRIEVIYGVGRLSNIRQPTRIRLIGR